MMFLPLLEKDIEASPFINGTFVPRCQFSCHVWGCAINLVYYRWQMPWWIDNSHITLYLIGQSQSLKPMLLTTAAYVPKSSEAAINFKIT